MVYTCYIQHHACFVLILTWTYVQDEVVPEVVDFFRKALSVRGSVGRVLLNRQGTPAYCSVIRCDTGWIRVPFFISVTVTLIRGCVTPL